MIYYARHLGDFAKDTALLSQGQVGAYDLLLDYYYTTEAPLPLDTDDLYNITRARTPAERSNTDKVVRRFFVKTDVGYMKGRVEEVIAEYREKSAKAAASAHARWANNKRTAERNANAMRTHSEGNAIHNPDKSLNPPTPRKRGSETDAAFGVFWTAFPRKVAKPKALQSWNRLHPDNALASSIMAGLEKAKRSEQWQRDGGRFIPHPATWLNQERWKDDEAPAVNGHTDYLPTLRPGEWT